MGEGQPRLIGLAVAALLVGAAPARAACDPVPPSTYEAGGPPLAGAPVNDPLFARQWGLEQMRVPEAWHRGFTGRGTVIAILDSGIDQSHPDLLPNMLPGADLHAVATGQEDCPPGPEDDLGHGTHTAGIAAARGNNGIGVAGVAPDAKILPLKVGDDQSIPFEAVVAGIRLAADQGADVMNISLGAADLPASAPVPALYPEIEAAVEYAWERGTVVVSSAGNFSLPACEYPASASHAVCVTASNRDGMPTVYSNQGVEPDETVVVRAPGGGDAQTSGCEDYVLSTYWPVSDFSSCPGPSGYATMAGTSMASPHVAGLVALLAGAGLTAPEIVERLVASKTGPWGIVNAAAATEGIPVPAPAPPPPPAPAAPAVADPGPSAAQRRCAQAKATLKLRERALRAARRRKPTRATRRLVARRAAARRVARRDVRRRCA